MEQMEQDTRVNTLWFHLYDVKQDKSSTVIEKKKNLRKVLSMEMMIDWSLTPEYFLGNGNCQYVYQCGCTMMYTFITTHQNVHFEFLIFF